MALLSAPTRTTRSTIMSAVRIASLNLVLTGKIVHVGVADAVMTTHQYVRTHKQVIRYFS